MAIRLAGPPRSTAAEDFGAAETILEKMGQREQLRQDKQSINDFVTENIRLSGINETLPPEVQLTPDQVSQRAAANISNKDPQYSGGIAGGFQKFASRFTGGPSTALTGPIASKLLDRSGEPTGIRRDLIKQQIESSRALTAQRKQKLEGTGEDSAKTALTKTALTSFLNKAVKGQPKIDRKGTLDNIYGEEAYRNVMKKAMGNKDEFGLSALEALGEVSRWWDKKFTDKEGKTWQHVQDRQAFSTEATPEEAQALAQIAPAILNEIVEAIYDGTLKRDEGKTIEAGLKADPTKAQQIVDEIRAGKGI